MRILFISSFYPPHSIGGWPLLVEDVNERLRARGHVTHVLTSNFGVTGQPNEPTVARVLNLDADLAHYRPGDHVRHGRRVAGNRCALTHAVEAFAPDVVSVQCMWNLSRSVPWLAERLCPGRVVYYVADHWPYAPDPHTAYWQGPGRRVVRRLLKRLLKPVALHMVRRWQRAYPLKFERVLCVSGALREAMIREAGLDPRRVRVVYPGIDIERFIPRSVRHRSDLRLLFVGSLVPHKGVHTAVEAMAILAARGRAEGISLTVVGAGHPGYERELRTLVAQHRLAHLVAFRCAVPRDQMPTLLHDFDALVFPSIWEEPLALVTQEAMACGLPVIGTNTGGTKEILVHGETGLVFQPGQAEQLADRIEYLRCHRDQAVAMAEHARGEVFRRFDIRRMVDELEAELHSAVRSAQPLSGTQ